MEPKDVKRTKYKTGALRSDRTGKGRFDLISPYALQRLALQYEHGAEQKGARNWELGFPISRALSSAIGHIMDRLKGDYSEDHLAAAAWQLFCAMHFEHQIAMGKLPIELHDVPLDIMTIPTKDYDSTTKVLAALAVILKGDKNGLEQKTTGV